ncbi:M23 family metallopeptidase [Kamptonema sp. UHCC 0994]|uniref:M23 family metallopeptidase n=1 Tax=Kamptonema sp. UHCC 0994 TaxID=3031329 RepID=UPI0023B9A414|nr:M23 family metallopeptidase [Kamptonema sp. UHCC 0994]MDF0552191.1 M23 family metallopeptidase [Kamptonema sp. UHCC 0994]
MVSLKKTQKTIEWLNSKPADKWAKKTEAELADKFLAPVKQVQEDLAKFKELWIKIELAKCSQKTNLTLLWLIFACVAYINVLHPLVIGSIKATSTPIKETVEKAQRFGNWLVGNSSAHEALARAFEAEVGKVYQPRAGEVPGPYCSFFMWSVFDKMGWKLPTTKQPIDKGLRGLTPGRGLAASWGADMAVGEINRDASKVKRGQVVLWTGTYGNFGAGAITHVGFAVKDAESNRQAEIVDKGSAAVIKRRSTTAPGGQFVASFFPKVPDAIAAKYPQQSSNSSSGNADFKFSGALSQPPQVGNAIAGYKVTSGFGPRVAPVAGASTYHYGVDVGTPVGTSLYAIGTPGKKVKVRCWNDAKGGGLVASYETGGIAFDYLHLSKCADGEHAVGSIIAQSGNSGIGTGAHLHFQQRDSTGKKVPPESGLIWWSLTGRKP